LCLWVSQWTQLKQRAKQVAALGKVEGWVPKLLDALDVDVELERVVAAPLLADYLLNRAVKVECDGMGATCPYSAPGGYVPFLPYHTNRPS
jgi:hypothetical protein